MSEVYDDEFPPQALIEALRTCRMTLGDLAADLRFEAPAAHGCRMVVAAIDALAHLITRRPHLFAEQDVGTRRDQTAEQISAPATERLLDALGECRGAAIRAFTAVKVQGVTYNATGMLTSSIDVLARMLTGEPGYYGTEGACGAPGRRSWSNDGAQREGMTRDVPASGLYWTELRIFLQVARSKSFNKAAQELGTTHPKIARAVRRVETELNTRCSLPARAA